MKLEYCPVYLLKGDLGYATPYGVTFENLEDLKATVLEDHLCEDHKLQAFSLTINETVTLYYDSDVSWKSGTMKIYYHFGVGDGVQLAKIEKYSIFDFLKYLELYNEFCD